MLIVSSLLLLLNAISFTYSNKKGTRQYIFIHIYYYVNTYYVKKESFRVLLTVVFFWFLFH
jgi:hypothetical protein